MSVSVTQSPEDYTPGYNPQLFVALSNQIAQDNFVYTVEITDLISSESIQYQIAKDPNDDRCYFDAMPFVENYLVHSIPINTYGWQSCTGAVRKIRVNIGETYGPTGSEVLTPGTDIDYIVWNGVEDFLVNADYDPDNYLYYAATGSNLPYLTANYDQYTYEDRSNYLYVLTSQPGDVLSITVNTYDSAGNPVTSSTIANPVQSSSNYAVKYICIDVGLKGLTNIDSGLVTGDYPIITDEVASYDISDSVITGAPPAGTVTPRVDFTVGCEPEYEVYTVHFWAKNGCFETIHFNKRSDIEVSRTETNYKVTPYTRSGGTMTYSRHSPLDKRLTSSRVERLKLCTDWLDDEYVALYEQILDSPVIYLDQGSSVSFARIKLINDSYKRNKSFNEPLYSLVMDFEYSHQNHRQR